MTEMELELYWLISPETTPETTTSTIQANPAPKLSSKPVISPPPDAIMKSSVNGPGMERDGRLGRGTPAQLTDLFR